jgi:hypothetical protein
MIDDLGQAKHNSLSSWRSLDKAYLTNYKQQGEEEARLSSSSLAKAR